MPAPTDPARSRHMALIRSKDTKPEMIVRRLAHALGYRFRLHRRDLPGRPDMVFPARRAVVFVNGCFWHGHHCGRGARTPKTNVEYWSDKIAANRRRDASAARGLAAAGWRVLTLWECELKDEARLAARLRRFLDRPTRKGAA